jgi:hypothetical protein
MRLMQEVDEDEVVAVFLRGELDSSRYGETLSALLARDGRGPDVLLRPDLGSAAENAYRRSVLDEHRAYGQREGLFLGFPERVEWHRAALRPKEVLEILFISWDWWLRLTDGSRRPADAARRIRAGEVPGVTAEAHEPVAAALGAGEQPELIAATTPALSPLVVVEGHVRLTAYALFPERLPDELEILLGISDEMPRWAQF